MTGTVAKRSAAALATILGALSAAALGVAAQAPPNSSIQQSSGAFSLHLPLTMRNMAREGMPIVRANPTAATPVASAVASATTPVTPTATMTPTVEVPSPTTTEAPPTTTHTPPPPTATSTPAMVCQELLQNGGFESGPVSWSVSVNSQQRPAADAIQPRSAAAVPPRTGEWVGWLGGLTQGLSVLQSAGLLTYEPRAVISATLQYYVALITEETTNRRPNDWVRVRLDGERRNLLAEGSARSDEDFAAQRAWMAVTADVTQYLLTDQVRRISLEVENDQERRSWFYLDDVSLKSCRASSPLGNR
jgi:hypothetical protein